MKITTIGTDLAKNAFQVHAVDERGHTLVRKQLRREHARPSADSGPLERAERTSAFPHALDPDRSGVVSAGEVGFEISCGAT